MMSVSWLVFREVYLKIILSVLAVVAAMLVLQNSLNQLKLRSLAAEATSSRLQISASTIETAIVRAEGLGLAMDEMEGLADLLDRELSRDGSIAKISIVSPIGTPVFQSGDATLPQDEVEDMLRRIMGTRDKVTVFDAGERLYTGRLLFDSSGVVMGAVILATPTEKYLAQAQGAFAKMHLFALIIFGCVTAVLVPFILFQFSGLNSAFHALDPACLLGAKARAAMATDTTGVQSAIDAGNAEYAAAVIELDELLAEADSKKRDTLETPA
ncbi:hypothetical protein [Epibacterium ulvae]|uniref:hypothetical protein n=1 Tax=Epibacterium ulvae TaxID=1156985 RepID=UPI00249098C8|nr:hypothetical protein [Epibacterium ulvae]